MLRKGGGQSNGNSGDFKCPHSGCVSSISLSPFPENKALKTESHISWCENTICWNTGSLEQCPCWQPSWRVPVQTRGGLLWYSALEKQLQIKISSALPFLFMPITTRNEATLDGSAATERPRQWAECPCVLLVGLWERKVGKWKDDNC